MRSISSVISLAFLFDWRRKCLKFSGILSCFLFMPVLSMKMKNVFKAESFKNAIPYNASMKADSKNIVSEKVDVNKTYKRSINVMKNNASNFLSRLGWTKKSWPFAKKIFDAKKLSKHKGAWETATIENPILYTIEEPIPKGVIFKKIPDNWRQWLSAEKAETIQQKNHKKFIPKKSSFGFSSAIFNRSSGSPFSKDTTARLIHTQAKIDKKRLGLGGEIAQEMSNNPEEFVKLLKANNLTVSDSARTHVDNKVQEYWEQIYKEAGLTEAEQKLLRDTINLKHEGRKNYKIQSEQDNSNSDFMKWKEENNITSYKNIHFQGSFHPYVKELIKEICKKRNIDFTIIAGITDLGKTQIANAGVAIIKTYNLLLKRSYTHNIDTVYSDSGRLRFNLNSKYWSEGEVCRVPYSKDVAAPILTHLVIEHELVHIEKNHPVESSLLCGYLLATEKLATSQLDKCMELLATSHEYEADTRILQTHSGAEKSLHFFSSVKDEKRGSAIYLSYQEGYELSERAVELYKIEQEMLEEESSKHNILQTPIEKI